MGKVTNNNQTLFKGTPEGGAVNDKIWAMGTKNMMSYEIYCGELSDHFDLRYTLITYFV